MPYIDSKVIQEAKRMDLLTYLKNYEPCHEFINGDRVDRYSYSVIKTRGQKLAPVFK